jgi:prepilin-type N-terminal cleavage/methylation domain-containing protein
MRLGFTLIEILVSLAVIGLLTAAFGASANVYLRNMSNRKAADQISLICGAIEAYDKHDWTKLVSRMGTTGVVTREVSTWPMWDMDGNGILDGTRLNCDPGYTPAGTTTIERDAVADTSSTADKAKLPFDYKGFLDHTRFRFNPGDSNANGELLDPWKRPYRIHLRETYLRANQGAAWNALFGAGKSGETLWYAIFSAGADGQAGNADDITSWKRHD